MALSRCLSCCGSVAVVPFLPWPEIAGAVGVGIVPEKKIETPVRLDGEAGFDDCAIVYCDRNRAKRYWDQECDGVSQEFSFLPENVGQDLM